MTSPAPAPAAAAALLAELIDDAGLFPPASLPMDEALAAHRLARGGAYRWMLGRFVCSAARIGELAEAAASEASLRLTILLGDDHGSWPSLAASVAEVVEGRAGWAVEVVEAPLVDAAVEEHAAALARVAGRLGASASFLELPWAQLPSEDLAKAAQVVAGTEDVGVKVRCGGLVADAFPPPSVLASVVNACAATGAPLKATAGLHHPYRHPDPATGAVMHGFVNLGVACALAFAAGGRGDEGELAAVLAEDDDTAFEVGDRLGWRGSVVGAGDVAAMRQVLFFGFGSCSFREPVDDLVAFGILPAPAAPQAPPGPPGSQPGPDPE